MSSSKAVFIDNGALGILAHLVESKLIFEDEYNLLLQAITNPSKAIKGVDEVLDCLVDKTITSYRSEDLFNLMGLLAKVCFETNVGLKQVKLNGELAKLPFGTPGRSMARWKTRYFRLVSNGLSYFGKVADTKPKGQLVITSTTHLRDSDSSGSKKNCFDIVTRNGTLSLSAQSENEKDMWVCGIARAVHACRLGESAKQAVLAPSINLAAGNIVGYNDASNPTNTTGFGDDLDSSMEKTGSLMKLAVSSRRNWKKRFFVLYRNLLSYYESEDDRTKRPKGDFVLDSDTTIKDGVPKDVAVAVSDNLHVRAELCFHLEFPNQTSIVLCANDEDEKKAWIDALSNGARRGEEFLLFQQQDQQNSSVGVVAQQQTSQVSVEVILTKSDRQGGSAHSIGMIPVTPYDTLVSIRSRIYKELDENDLPLDFCFLLRTANKAMRADINKLSEQSRETGDLFVRFLTTDYTKVSRTQEQYLGVEKVLEDGGKIHLFYQDMHITDTTRATSLKTTPSSQPQPPIPPNLGAILQQKQQQAIATPVDTKDNGSTNSSDSVSTSIGTSAHHEEERRKWEKEIKRLRSELSEAHNTILMLQQQGSSGGATSGLGRALSPLETKLMGLQQDGYIEESVSMKTLAKQYRSLFDGNDISAILLADDGAFAPLLRRYAHDPQHIREFMEAVEAVLKEHTISKLRLVQPWWKKKLGDAMILKMSKSELEKWAKQEPWTDDTPERYAYLMGKMRPGAVTESMMTILKPKPEFVEDDDDDSDDEQQDDAVTTSTNAEEVEQKQGGPPKPAFLKSIQQQRGAAKPAFLTSIEQQKPKPTGARPKPSFIDSINKLQKK